VIAVYVSGHGFGHATRIGEVLQALREAEPHRAIAISSAAPEALFRSSLRPPLSYRRLECDVGLVQKGALTIDLEKTATRCSEFGEAFPGLVKSQADFLRRRRVRLVLGDIPPLASAAADVAGIPSVALGNFSWDWIYGHYSRYGREFLDASALAREAYSKTTLLLELPFAGDLGAFPRRAKIPLVARRPRHSRDEVRALLGLGEDPLVLWSFGGAGLPGFDPAVLSPLGRFRFLSVGENGSSDNFLVVPPERLAAKNLSYIDLVGAADCVATKPGYGIVTDAIGAGSRLLYTDRGDFPEYPILVREMAPLLPTQYVAQKDLLAGRIGASLEALLEVRPSAPPDLSGAERAAHALLGLLRDAR
jgi:hypothetical protein